MLAHRFIPLVFVVVAAASGCGKSISIAHWVAPTVDIGSAHRLVITDSYGRSESVAAIKSFAVEHSRQSSWFDDVIDLGARDRLESDGVNAWLRSGTLAADALYVRFDVLEHSAVVSSNESLVDNGTGSTALVIDEHLVAHTLIALTVADVGGTLLDEVEIEGIHERSGEIRAFDIDAAMETAARAAVSAALALITPVPMSTAVAFDDRDPATNAIIDAVIDADINADINEAAEARRTAITLLSDLDSTPALYNRAVLTESVGEIAAAVQLYKEANAKSDAADFYSENLAAARRRLNDAQRLGLSER